jgi:hypothetical protein
VARRAVAVPTLCQHPPLAGFNGREYRRAKLDDFLPGFCRRFGMGIYNFMKSDNTNERTMISVTTTKMIWLVLGRLTFLDCCFPLAIFYNKPF